MNAYSIDDNKQNKLNVYAMLGRQKNGYPKGYTEQDRKKAR